VLEVGLVGAVGCESGCVWAGSVEVSCSSFSSGLAKKGDQQGEDKKGRHAEVEADQQAHDREQGGSGIEKIWWPVELQSKLVMKQVNLVKSPELAVTQISISQSWERTSAVELWK